MTRTLRHFGAVLITVAVVAALGIMLNHFASGPSAGGHVTFRQLLKGPPPNGKIGGQGNIFIGPPNRGGTVDVHDLLNTLTLLVPGIAIVATLASLTRRSRRSRRKAEPDTATT